MRSALSFVRGDSVVAKGLRNIMLVRRGETTLAEIRCAFQAPLVDQSHFEVVHLPNGRGTFDPEQVRAVRELVHALTHPTTKSRQNLLHEAHGAARDEGDPRSIWPWSILSEAEERNGVLAMSDDALDAGRHRLADEFMAADHGNVLNVMERALTTLRRQDGVEIHVENAAAERYLGRLSFRLVSSARPFALWFDAGDDLYIVPPYHPQQNGKQAGPCVNGDTDALIAGSPSIASLRPPNEATAAGKEPLDFGSWGNMRHPWKAEGHDLGLEIDLFLCRTRADTENLTSLLRAALGLDPRKYAAILGGFRPPLPSPHEVARRLRLSGIHVRGTEGHAVWTYRTLKTEGQLTGARIPRWFKKERWLERYAAYERRCDAE